MSRLYISGPVTGIPNDNREAFAEARIALDAAGHFATIPHAVIAPGAPHEEAMRHGIHALTEDRWYGGVALLPGWEQSEGAKLEKAVAEACGIPCKTVDEWIEEARC